MASISKEYLLLFNAVTDAEQALDLLRGALVEAQRQAEELYLDSSGEGGFPDEAPGGGAG